MIKKALTILLAFMGYTAQATITLPALFGNNMVLQQQADAAIWGTAKANATITILTSWDKKKYTIRANAAGNWKTTVRTPKAGGQRIGRRGVDLFGPIQYGNAGKGV